MALILLFEDEKILRENTQELLEVNGYSCITAIDGKECLKLTLETKPDLILCDIMLPYVNGYDIKKQLNQWDETANIPFIYLSAKIEEADKKRGFELGATAYIVKPFKINEPITSIEANLTRTIS